MLHWSYVMSVKDRQQELWREAERDHLARLAAEANRPVGRRGIRSLLARLFKRRKCQTAAPCVNMTSCCSGSRCR